MATEAPVTQSMSAPALARSEWRTAALLAVGAVIGLRLLLSLWAAFVLARFPTTDLASQYAHVGFPIQGGAWVAPWEREDALWYEKIGARGYATEGTTAFFPLLPLLMRIVSVLTGGNVAWAGLLVSGVAAAVAFAVLYRLVARDTDTTTAGRTVAYLALFPTAFFLYAAYTESLFLALTIGAFWLARERRWGLVAALAVLAGLTKAQGALIGLPLLAEYLIVTGWRPWQGGPWRERRRLLEAAMLAGAGALGTAAFFAYTRFVVNDPVPWSTRETLQWQQQASWPGETLATAMAKLASAPGVAINWFDLGALLLFTALAVAAFRLRPSYGVLAAVALVSTWFHVRADFPLVSVSRYVLAAFPCFIVLAVWVGRRPRIVHLLIIAFWISWLLIWTSQSVRGYWVG